MGTPQFEKFLADAMGALVDFDFITMARYSTVDEPRFLIHSHTFPTHMAELFLSEFISCDPYLHHWRDNQTPGVIWLQDIVRSNGVFDRYTNVFLPQIGVVDEIGVFLPAVANDSVAIFFNKRQIPFFPEDSQRLENVFESCAALYRLHVRTLLNGQRNAVEGSPSLGRPLRLTNDTGATIWVTNEWAKQVLPESEFIRLPLDDRFGISDKFLWTIDHQPNQKANRSDLTTFEVWASAVALTPREKDIVGLIFQGHNGASIAERLDLSLRNIKNHKRRIYRKLDITSERELFLMFFGAIS